MKYKTIFKHYEACFEEHGDTHLGVDWPNELEAITRHNVMLGLINEINLDNISLLDFGCGTAMLLDTLHKDPMLKHINYVGLDISKVFIDECRNKYKTNEFICRDVIEEGGIGKTFHYAVMNGVFTEKRSLSDEEMKSFFSSCLTSIFPEIEKGIAFNLMSKDVDWERDDLFHVSYDWITDFLTRNLSRNYIIRRDYGLYEYTVYLYK